MRSWVDHLRERRLHAQRDLQRQRGMRVLLRLANEQGALLLQGTFKEWSLETERARALRHAEQQSAELAAELRMSQERCGGTRNGWSWLGVTEVRRWLCVPR